MSFVDVTSITAGTERAMYVKFILSLRDKTHFPFLSHDKEMISLNRI